MGRFSNLSLKKLSLRFFAYGALLLLLAWLAHLYVTNPLYVKKLPYFAEAFWTGFDVECDPTAPSELGGMLTRVSLPYFALKGEVSYIDAAGNAHGCRIQKGEQEEKALFRLASMTKVVTAFAMLELAEAESIDLDSRVIEFFPEVDPTKVQDEHVLKVTLTQLLNHSSGLGGPFGSDNMVKEGEQPWCPYDIKQMEKIRLAGEPGSNHLYTNVAYCLLGEIIARVSGVEFRAHIRDTYLSNYPSLDFVEGDYLPGEPQYDFSNDYRFGERYVDWLDFQALSSAAGLIGDPKEFALLIRELFQRNPDVLLNGGIEGCREKGLERCYSYPFVIVETEGGPIGIQQGYLPGASSMVAVNSRGEVLVWVAPGAALESKHKDLMVDRVVALLTR